MNGDRYVLDASVFIEAAGRYYALDFAPRFWESLVAHARDGRVMSIDRVQEELGRGNDDLAAWADGHFSSAFTSTAAPDVIDAYREMMAWVQSQDQFFDAAKADFAAGADGWLVAYARANGCVVVTQEVHSPDVKRKVPIPNLCEAFDVRWVDTFAMLRNLRVRWA
jgi:hypothetical protein